jgi:hypothetical protein
MLSIFGFKKNSAIKRSVANLLKHDRPKHLYSHKKSKFYEDLWYPHDTCKKGGFKSVSIELPVSPVSSNSITYLIDCRDYSQEPFLYPKRKKYWVHSLQHGSD